ncbi:hypothetical protein SPONN_2792 [uncultured Candidatus Thioglobus sp.]|nr:hypothetical protein SPONN_2792 [uncultured Candidatus Thioglobus sp.]
MKKQLLVAAVAATMASVSSVSMADISIKGDATFEYANIDNDVGSSTNATRQRVRLHVTGKSGDTTVKLGVRNDGRTRVAGGDQNSEGARSSGSGAGNHGSNTSQLNVDYLYLTTKIGVLNIKAGDWWDTTGLGVARKGKADADRVEFSTKAAGWKLGIETGADSSSTVLSASGKVAGFTVKVEHNTAVSVDGADTVFVAGNPGSTETAAVTATCRTAGDAGDALTNNAKCLLPNSVIVTQAVAAVDAVAATADRTVAAGLSGLDATHNGKYTDISIKGKVGAVGVAAEYFNGTNDTTGADADASVLHLWTKASGITWHVAYAQTDAGVAGITGSGNKFSPLGVSILANAPGVNGAGAIGNFGNTKDDVYGVRADMKLAGMGVQVAVGNLSLNNDAVDDGFYDIIVKRPLGKGSSIQFSRGSFNDVDSTAAKISVKF